VGAAEAAARGDVEVARLLYRHALAEQAFNTVRAYWSARAAQAAVAVQRDDEARAQRLHDGIRVLVETRIFAPNILLQSEANLRQKSTSTHAAELTALDATFTLGRIMGLPAAELARAVAPDQALPADITSTAAAEDAARRVRWIERALRQRADFLAVRQSEVPLRVLAQQAELDLKPRVDLSVRGGYAGLSRGHSVIEPLTQRLTGANGELGVMLEWPGANTYQRGLLRSRRAAMRQAELTTAQLQSDIAADVCAALAEVRLRAETMRNAGATAAIARKAVEQEQRRLQTGEATVLDVINLENLMSSARLSQIDAQAGYAIAVARLRYAVGEVFLPDQADRSFPLADLTQLPADEK
jgi:outer membrane protein TolC